MLIFTFLTRCHPQKHGQVEREGVCHDCDIAPVIWVPFVAFQSRTEELGCHHERHSPPTPTSGRYLRRSLLFLYGYIGRAIYHMHRMRRYPKMLEHFRLQIVRVACTTGRTTTGMDSVLTSTAIAVLDTSLVRDPDRDCGRFEGQLPQDPQFPGPGIWIPNNIDS